MSFKSENDISIHKLVAITTDRAWAMPGVRTDFLALCHNDSDFLDYVNYHCVIHQQALGWKFVSFSQPHVSHVMTVVVKLMNLNVLL